MEVLSNTRGKNCTVSNICPKKFFLPQAYNYLALFSYKMFHNFSFIFSSMIHINLIFMYGMSYGQDLLFFHMDIQYLKEHLF